MVVTGRQQLSSDDIEKMIKEAQMYEEQDKRRREEIELKNRADDTAYHIEKILNENGDKIPEDIKNRLEEIIRDLRDAINKDDIPRIKMLFDELQNESMKIGEFLYNQQAQGTQSSTGSQVLSNNSW